MKTNIDILDNDKFITRFHLGDGGYHSLYCIQESLKMNKHFWERPSDFKKQLFGILQSNQFIASTILTLDFNPEEFDQCPTITLNLIKERISVKNKMYPHRYNADENWNLTGIPPMLVKIPYSIDFVTYIHLDRPSWKSFEFYISPLPIHRYYEGNIRELLDRFEAVKLKGKK